jgi:hypothetical protein
MAAQYLQHNQDYTAPTDPRAPAAIRFPSAQILDLRLF